LTEREGRALLPGPGGRFSAGPKARLRAGLAVAALVFAVSKPAEAYNFKELPNLQSIMPVVRGLDLDEDRHDMLAGGSIATTAPDEGGIRIIPYALSWLGVPYRLGGYSSSGIDCSGFLNRALSASFPFLDNIPRQSDAFAAFGESVDDIEPGDILLFASGGSIYHVGLALSATTFIHSASEGDRTGVIISSIWDGNWHARLSGVRRIRF
jgi:probable lipoprotein NlpC